jgi:hypothetical protein
MGMVDIQTVSIAIASASVVAGVIYYSLQIRHQNLQIQQQTKMRQTDLLVRLYSTMTGKDWLEAWEKFNDRGILTYDDYKEKYGFVEFNEVYMLFDEIGSLLQKGLIDIDLMPFGAGQAKVTWEKIKPLLEVARKRFNEPKMGQGSEYLYNELKKREQRGVNNG